MECDPARMCELLVGLGDVEVLGIDDKEGAPLRVRIRRRVPRPPCGGAAGCCGPTVSDRWRWWTSPRSAARCGWCGTSAAGAAPAAAARRAAPLSRRRRSRRRGRC